ncbi:MAG TPA: MFS transporter [Geminicoccaceae bacterium]|nr:MFS transporter [Geminicoccus sp.]HMU51624.1 MFS transporter [Geminicoccaceae bacterium]
MSQSAPSLTIDQALERSGVGPFQYRLLGIFGLVWAVDAMQVLVIGFAAPSLAASFGLTIPQAIQAGTVFFLGMLIGAWGFGRLADRIGRRKVLIATVLMDAVFGLASVFAGDFTLLLALRLLTGIGVGGTLPVDYAMMAEFLPPRNRGRWLVALEGFWAVGTVAVALAAWAANHWAGDQAWRWLFAATALPAVVGFWLRLWLPESPHYLLHSGREQEARRVLDNVARANGQVPSVSALAATASPRARMRDLLAPALRRRTLLILAAWLLISTAYYGVFIWLPGRLVTQGYGFVRGYGFLVLLALAQLPGYALAAWGVEAIGRRRTLIAFLVASAAGCLLFVFAEQPGWIATSLLAMSFALLGTWGGLYAYTPELYPTGLRATGMGMAGAMARVGGLLGPSVVGLIIGAAFHFTIGLFAVLLLLAALAVGLIEVETKGKPLGQAAT